MDPPPRAAVPRLTSRLLLDEMFTPTIAERLVNHDVRALVANPAMVGTDDASVLRHATAEGRAVVTRNIKDFVALDRKYRGEGRAHAGLALVSTKRFPEDRTATAALIRALGRLLAEGGVPTGDVIFLQR